MKGHKKGDPGRIPFGAMLAALRWGDFRQEDVCQSLGLRFVKVDVVRHSSRNFRLHSHEEWVDGCYHEVDEHGRKKFSVWEEENGTRWIAAIPVVKRAVEITPSSMNLPPPPPTRKRKHSGRPRSPSPDSHYSSDSPEEEVRGESVEELSFAEFESLFREI